MASSDSDRLVRRLRKKLRQIENLEILRRDLNEEELAKVDKKNDIRLELNSLLRDLPSLPSQVSQPDSEEVDGFTLLNASDDQSDEMKRKSTEPRENLNETKKQCPVPAQATAGSTEDEAKNVVETEAAGPSSGPSNVVKTRGEKSIRTRDPPPAASVGAAETSRPTKERERQRLISSWRGSLWAVTELEGHEDLVVDCDLGAGLAVTASRDTTVKVWSLTSGELVTSLRGHTGPVTGVRLLTLEDSGRLAAALGDGEEERRELAMLAVSGSQDCCLKVWDTQAGSCVRSYYTYNGITALQILPGLCWAITATDGGKLEVFNLQTGTCLLSQTVHPTTITALSSSHLNLVTADSQATLKIFKLKLEGEGCTLSCVFQSEDLTFSLNQRPILGVRMPGGETGGEKVYLADSGSSLKVLEWKTGRLSKVPNHEEDFGFTDCLCETGDLLVVSSYDLDTGCGGLNLLHRDLQHQQDLTYLATLSDQETSRILSVSARQDEGLLKIITAGQEVKLWSRLGPDSQGQEDVLRATARSLVGSQTLSDSELSEDEIEGSSSNQTVPGGPFNDKTTGFCNCSLM